MCQKTRFTVEDRSVVDSVTGLRWQRTVTLTDAPWAEAQNWCSNSSFDPTNINYRLPTKDELRSLLDINQPTWIDPVAFPNTPPTWTWTSTPGDQPNEYWQVDFGQGGTSSYDASLPSAVRCGAVRALTIGR